MIDEKEYQILQVMGEMMFAKMMGIPLAKCVESRALQVLPSGLKVLVVTKPCEEEQPIITQADLALKPDLVAIMTGAGREFRFRGMIDADDLNADLLKMN
ncbi:MAG: hypothetical protein ABSF77_19830 [Spirochaetia bacterium]|jgi:hypothetical protein